MTSANQPRFRFLIGWCCLMSSAILMITAYLAIFHKLGTCTTGNEESNGKTDQQIGLPSGPSSNDYIHLIRDNEIWICDPCESRSLSPKNSTVEIAVSGLYYFHAQVTFQFINKTPNSATVTLRKNKTPGTQDRTLSKVKQYGSGTANIIRLVELTEKDIISLEIEAINSISRQNYDTYWEIIFLNNK